MQGALLKEGIELHFFKTAWCVQAFLVTGGYVTGSRLTQSLSFSAFKDDNIACHNRGQ